MRNRQRGVTLIGWLVLLAPMALVIYAGIRVTPIYLNYMKVSKTLNEVASEFKAGGASPSAIGVTIDKHFEIDMVNYPTAKDIKITRDGSGWAVEAAYDDEAPLFDNISLHVSFDKIVHAGGE
jgi:hypothetical protein